MYPNPMMLGMCYNDEELNVFLTMLSLVVYFCLCYADFSQCLWDNVNVNEDSFMYMLDEQTPIKDCAGLGYQVYDVVGTFLGLEHLYFKLRSC